MLILQAKKNIGYGIMMELFYEPNDRTNIELPLRRSLVRLPRCAAMRGSVPVQQCATHE